MKIKEPKVKKIQSIIGQGGGKSGGAASTGAVEDADTLESQSNIAVIDLIGEGEIGGLVAVGSYIENSVYLNGISLRNADGTYNFKNSTGLIVKTTNGATEIDDINNPKQYTNIPFEQRTGAAGQSMLESVTMIESPNLMADAGALLYGTPKSFTITQKESTRIKVLMSFPRLSYMDKTNGNLHGIPASDPTKYSISISTNGSATGGVKTMFSISGKCSSTYQRTHTFDLPTLPSTSSGWVVTVQRETIARKSEWSDQIIFSSVDSIIDTKLNYENSALVMINIDPRTFSSVPKREYLVNGLKIRVPNSISWDFNLANMKNESSSNPAWILFDILTNKRYGLGNYVSETDIDLPSLYQIGKYCEQEIETGAYYPDGSAIKEPRFALNTVIQQQSDAYKIISDITSVFRGMAFWSGGKIQFIHDAPKPAGTVFSIFTNANVIDGMFEYTGSARKDRHSAALVTWNDPSNHYKQQVEYVEFGDTTKNQNYRTVQTVAFGCTSRTQAHRVGRWVLYTEQFESNLINFKTGLEGSLIFPGDVIELHDQYRAGVRFGGRIVSADQASRVFVIDSPIPERYNNNTGDLITPNTQGGTLQLNVVRMDGGRDIYTIVNIDATNRAIITVSESIANLSKYQDNALFLITNSVVGTGVLNPMKARVTAVMQDTDGVSYGITCVEHNPDKYLAIEKDLVLEHQTTSTLTNAFNPVMGKIVVDEYTKFIAPSVLAYAILISWDSNAQKFTLSYRINKPNRDKTVPPIRDERGIEHYPVILDVDGKPTYQPGSWTKKYLENKSFFEILGGIEVDDVIDISVFGTYAVTGKDTPTENTSYKVKGAISDAERIKAPMNFTATTPKLDFNSINLSWVNHRNVSGVALYRSNENKVSTATATMAIVTGNSYVVRDLPMNSTWYFWAESIDNAGIHSHKTGYDPSNPLKEETGIAGSTMANYGNFIKAISDDFLTGSPLFTADGKLNYDSGAIGGAIDSKVAAAMGLNTDAKIASLVDLAIGEGGIEAMKSSMIDIVTAALPDSARSIIDAEVSPELANIKDAADIDLSFLSQKVNKVRESIKSESDTMLTQVVYSHRADKSLKNLNGVLTIHESRFEDLSDKNQNLLRRVDALALDNGKNTALIGKIEEVRVSELEAIANVFEQVVSKVNENMARITLSERTRANSDSAFAQQISTVEATVAGVGDSAITESKKTIVGWCSPVGSDTVLDAYTTKDSCLYLSGTTVEQKAAFAKGAGNTGNRWVDGALADYVLDIKAEIFGANGEQNIATIVSNAFATALPGSAIANYKGGITAQVGDAISTAKESTLAAAGVWCVCSGDKNPPDSVVGGAYAESFGLDVDIVSNPDNSLLQFQILCRNEGVARYPWTTKARWATHRGASIERSDALIAGTFGDRMPDGSLKPFASILSEEMARQTETDAWATTIKELSASNGIKSAVINSVATVLSGKHCVKETKDGSGAVTKTEYLTNLETEDSCLYLDGVATGNRWADGVVASNVETFTTTNDLTNKIVGKVTDGINTSIGAMDESGNAQTAAQRIFNAEVSSKEAKASSSTIESILTGGACYINGALNTTTAYNSEVLCKGATGGVWHKGLAIAVKEWSQFAGKLEGADFAGALDKAVSGVTEGDSGSKFATFSQLTESVYAQKAGSTAAAKNTVLAAIGTCTVGGVILPVIQQAGEGAWCDSRVVCLAATTDRISTKDYSKLPDSDTTTPYLNGLNGDWTDGAITQTIKAATADSTFMKGGKLSALALGAIEATTLQDLNTYERDKDGKIVVDKDGNKVVTSVSALAQKVANLDASVADNTNSISTINKVKIGGCVTNYYTTAAGVPKATTASAKWVIDFNVKTEAEMNAAVSAGALTYAQINYSSANNLKTTAKWVGELGFGLVSQQVASQFGSTKFQMSSVSDVVGQSAKNTIELSSTAGGKIAGFKMIQYEEDAATGLPKIDPATGKLIPKGEPVIKSDFVFLANRFAIGSPEMFNVDFTLKDDSTGILPFVVGNKYMRDANGVFTPGTEGDGTNKKYVYDRNEDEGRTIKQTVYMNDAMISTAVIDKLHANFVSANRFVSKGEVGAAVIESMNDVTVQAAVVGQLETLSTYTITLSNDSQDVVAAADGTVAAKDLGAANTTVSVMKGTTDVTNLWTFTKEEIATDTTSDITQYTASKPPKLKVTVFAKLPTSCKVTVIATLKTDSTVTLRKDFTVVKSFPGADGKSPIIYDLNVTPIVKKISAGVFEPSSIKLAARKNTGGVVIDAPTLDVSYKVYLGSSTVEALGGNTISGAYTIPTDFSGTTIKVELYDATGTNLKPYDIQTITFVADGAIGKSPYAMSLSNESQHVPADKDGKVTDASCLSAFTNIKVLLGTTVVTDWTFAKVDGTGVTSTISGSKVTLTAFADASDNGKITITGTSSDGLTTLKKDFTVVKSKAAINGTSPTIYSLTTPSIVKRLADGSYSPNPIIFSSTQQTGSGLPTAATGVKYEIHLEGKETTETIVNGKYTILSSNDIKPLKVKLFSADGLTEYDTQGITVVSDGIDGKSPYAMSLTNESQHIPAKADGTVLVDDAKTAFTDIKVMFGTTEIKDWTFSKDETNVTSNFSTNADGSKKLTLASFGNTSDSGKVKITGTSSDGLTTLKKDFTVVKSKAATDGTSPTIYSLTTPSIIKKLASGALSTLSVPLKSVRKKDTTTTTNGFSDVMYKVAVDDGVAVVQSVTPYVIPSPFTGNTITITLWNAAGTENYDTQTITIVADGINGTKTAIVDMYKVATSQPTSFPDGNVRFTWETAQFTLEPGFTTNGWSITPPSDVAAPNNLYVTHSIHTSIAGTNATDIFDTAFSATTTKVIAVSGENGTRTGFLEVYQWANLPPAKPVGTSEYTWETGAFTFAAPGISNANSWSLAPEADPAKKNFYTCSIAVSNKDTGAKTTVDWSGTTKIVTKGVAGTVIDTATDFKALMERLSLTAGAINETIIEGKYIATGSIVADHLKTNILLDAPVIKGGFWLASEYTGSIQKYKPTVYKKINVEGDMAMPDIMRFDDTVFFGESCAGAELNENYRVRTSNGRVIVKIFGNMAGQKIGIARFNWKHAATFIVSANGYGAANWTTRISLGEDAIINGTIVPHGGGESSGDNTNWFYDDVFIYALGNKSKVIDDGLSAAAFYSWGEVSFYVQIADSISGLDSAQYKYIGMSLPNGSTSITAAIVVGDNQFFRICYRPINHKLDYSRKVGPRRMGSVNAITGNSYFMAVSSNILDALLNENPDVVENLIIDDDSQPNMNPIAKIITLPSNNTWNKLVSPGLLEPMLSGSCIISIDNL